jgi:hypothetical protein
MFIEYTSQGQAHVAIARLPTSGDDVLAASMYTTLKNAMLPLMAPTDRVTGARYSAAGSNISFPMLVTPGTGSGAAQVDDEIQPRFFSFTGRSADGRRVKFTLFTGQADTNGLGYRDTTPSAAQQTLLTALGSTQADVRSISGQPVRWNTYVNLGENAYFQRKNRRTNAK